MARPSLLPTLLAGLAAGRRTASVLLALALVLLLVLALLGVRRLGAHDVPSDPYAVGRPPGEDSSVAGPVATGGEVDAVAAGLKSLGFFCAQVRSDAQARQVWCRATTEAADPFFDPDVTVVNLVTTPAGTLGYADVVLPTGQSMADPSWSDRLRTVLDASVLALWPDDARAVGQTIASVLAGRPRKDRGDPYPSFQKTVNTRHATYRVGDAAGFTVVDGEPTLSFHLVTTAVPARWPLSSVHYATTTVAAAPALEAAGADCYGPQQLPCVGPGNESLEYRTAPSTDQVVSADFFVPGGGPADQTTSGRSAPGGHEVGTVLTAGLPFLTPAVRPAVRRQILRSRRDGKPFAGIVAQTVVVVEPLRPLRPPRSEALPVQVSVGVPLIDP